MTVVQPELFQQPRHGADADVAWLEGACLGRKDWSTAAELLGLLQRAATESNKRWIRHLANKTANVILGQKGYKHIEHATIEEVNHAANTLESQGKKMTERAQAIRKNAHRIFG